MNTELYIIFDTYKGSIFADEDGFPFTNWEAAHKRWKRAFGGLERYEIMYLGKPEKEKVELASQKPQEKIANNVIIEDGEQMELPQFLIERLVEADVIYFCVYCNFYHVNGNSISLVENSINVIP